MFTNRLECIDVELGSLLAPYVAGRLSPKERRLCESHLAACHRCAEDEPVMRRLVQAIVTLPSDEVTRAVAAAPARRQIVKYRGGPPRMRTTLAAALAILAVIGAFSWQRARHTAVAREVDELQSRLAALEEQSASGVQSVASQPPAARGNAWVPGVGFRVAVPPSL